MTTSRKHASAVSASTAKSKIANEKTVGDDSSAPEVAANARNGTRSSSAAFGNNSDSSTGSPARKKQNTAMSITDKSAFENDRNISRTSINIDTQTSANGSPIDFDFDSTVRVKNSLPRLSIETEEAELQNSAPPAAVALTRPTALERTSNIIGAKKIVGIETRTASPQITKHDNLETKSADGTSADNCPAKPSNCKNGDLYNRPVVLERVGIFIFINLFIFSGMVWSGLILNGRATYQLESLECQERLRQAYQAMGLTKELGKKGDNDGDTKGSTNDENNISDLFEEHQFFWKELEDQVRYWKKEAKKYQRYGEGFRKQCQDDLQLLILEIGAQKLGDPLNL